jgi:signal transduction histidine kinase/ActR/RegA family two-component response regulator
MATSEPDVYRVLVLAPTRRDAQATRGLLARAQIRAEAYDSVRSLLAQISTPLGAIVLTDSAFRDTHLHELTQWLSQQPPWSDIPLVLLCQSGPHSPLAARVLESMTNVTVLERPTSSRTLLSSVQAALRARKRQYQMREQFEALRHSEERLRATESALREADHRKDLFLATLAHELRNPLAPIRTAVQLLGAPQLSSQKLRWAQEVIQRQTKHMALLLDDLLDVARITQGKLVLKKEHVTLNHAVEAAVETARPIIDEKRHQLTVALPALAPTLDADSLRLSQILSNLLTNAAKYTNAGGQIGLTCTVEDSDVCIAVKDNGIGIPKEALARIFEMFSQVDGASELSGGGLGIGLSLVKGLVELHGGTVEAKSAGSGQGSEFIVRLPLAATMLSAAEPPVLAALSPQRDSVRVLVADDNRDAADSLALLLSLAGHEVRVAHNGCIALQVAQTFLPHAAVLDIGMPGLDGYDVAQELRHAAWGADICLIALTGRGRDSDRQRAHAVGFNHYLIKPIDPEVLQSMIASSLAERRSPSARRCLVAIG